MVFSTSVGLTLVGVFVLEALAHSPEPTIKKSGVPGLIQGSMAG